MSDKRAWKADIETSDGREITVQYTSANSDETDPRYRLW
jgi:hypothetical protein